MDGERFFRDAALAAGRLAELARRRSDVLDELDGAESPTATQGPHARGGSLSDPVWRAMLRRRGLSLRLSEIEASMREQEAVVGECLAVLRGMSLALGERTAHAMERHYLDGLTWDAVAAEAGASARTVLRWRSVAIDWLSDVGPRLARAGCLTRGDGEAISGPDSPDMGN